MRIHEQECMNYKTELGLLELELIDELEAVRQTLQGCPDRCEVSQDACDDVDNLASVLDGVFILARVLLTVAEQDTLNQVPVPRVRELIPSVEA